MPLKNLTKITHTLAFRLTVWYAGIFIVSVLGALIFLFLLMTSTLHKRMDQDLLNESKEFSSLIHLEGIEKFKTAIILESESEGVGKVFYRLISRDGTLVGSSNLSSWDFISDESALKRLNTGTDYFFETMKIPGTPHKARILYSVIDTDNVLQIGQSMEDDEEFLETSQEIFGATLLILILFSGLAGGFMAKRALKGVDDVAKTAINISHDDFNSRVPITGRGEEIDRLAITFNDMLEHIQTLIKGMKEMTDNIAHDLRNPITRIRGTAETTLMTFRGSDDFEIMAGSIIEECDRLLGMINTMLDISEAEAGVSKMDMTEIDISALISNACELFQPVADDKEIRLIRHLKANTLIFADNQKLQRVISNLLDNALKYTPKGGTVTVSSDRNENEVFVSFTDNGIGISEENLPRIFERFYRCDRSRSEAGIGLGLSFAQAIARAHGGDISVSSFYGRGSSFTLTLPILH
jgi:signal transduction histidine kinase